MPSLSTFTDPIKSVCNAGCEHLENFCSPLYDSERGQEATYKVMSLVARLLFGQENSKLQTGINGARAIIDTTGSASFWRYMWNPAKGDVARGKSFRQDLADKRLSAIAKRCLLAVDSHAAIFQLFSDKWKPGISGLRSAAVLSFCALDGKDQFNALRNASDRTGKINAALGLAQRSALTGLVASSTLGIGKGNQLLIDLLQVVDASCSMTSVLRNKWYTATKSKTEREQDRQDLEAACQTGSKNMVLATSEKLGQGLSWFAQTLACSGHKIRKHSLALASKGVKVFQALKPNVDLSWAKYLHASSKGMSLWKGFFAPVDTLKAWNMLPSVPQKPTLRKNLNWAMEHFFWLSRFIGEGTEFLGAAKHFNLLDIPFLTDEFGEGGLMNRMGSYTGWTNILEALRDVGGVGLVGVTLKNGWQTIEAYKDEEQNKGDYIEQALLTTSFACKSYSVLVAPRLAGKWQWADAAAAGVGVGNAMSSLMRHFYKQWKADHGTIVGTRPQNPAPIIP